MASGIKWMLKKKQKRQPVPSSTNPSTLSNPTYTEVSLVDGTALSYTNGVATVTTFPTMNEIIASEPQMSQPPLNPSFTISIEHAPTNVFGLPSPVSYSMGAMTVTTNTLPIGTSGQVLTFNGTGGAYWTSPPQITDNLTHEEVDARIANEDQIRLPVGDRLELIEE